MTLRGLFLFWVGWAGFASASNSFTIGGDNSDEAIRALTHLTGLSIQEIEARGRPCRYTKWKGCSGEGFLGKNESLVSRLLTDNQFIHSKGLTHAKLASYLITVMELPAASCTRKNSAEVWYGGVCVINGNKYAVHFLLTFGWQDSIFNDTLRGSRMIQVTNLQTGQKIEFADLLPHYVQRYGFYEGETAYRLAPETIVRMFAGPT